MGMNWSFGELELGSWGQEIELESQIQSEVKMGERNSDWKGNLEWLEQNL